MAQLKGEKEQFVVSHLGEEEDTGTNSSDELVKNIEAELTCAVCLKGFDDPRVLPCLHTYCRKCVESLLDKSQEVNPSIVCPQCREEHELPKDGVGQLPTSPTFGILVRLLEVVKADQPGSSALTCQTGRDSNPAIARCLDCDSYLCDSCMELHKMRTFSRQHIIVTLDEIKESRGRCFHRPRHCTVHQKVLKLYCCTCNELICDNCTDLHKSHDPLIVSHVQTELRKRLNDFISQLRELSDEVEQRKEMMYKLVEKHKANVAAIHAKVDNTINELVELLKKRQDEIHNEIDAHAEQEMESISAEVEYDERTLTRLTSSVSFVDSVLQTASDYDLVTLGLQTVEQCEELENIKIDMKEKEQPEWDFDGVEDHSDKVACMKVKVKLPLDEESCK